MFRHKVLLNFLSYAVFIAVAGFFGINCYAGDIASYGRQSVFGQREASEKRIFQNHFAIAFYKPTYVLPFYYTRSPYQQVYVGHTPDEQKIQSQEFKAQFSIQVPLFFDIVGKDSELSIAYTQRMYWQFYAKSQFFRETNYQPELFFSKKISPNFWVNLGVEHESNGRGGKLERSWNRAYVNAIFSKGNFAMSIRPWMLIFKRYSSDTHNSDITYYLGHGELILSYKLYHLDLSWKMRNNFESGFRRGANELSCSVPVLGKIKLYVQYFTGYGQSLIEYDHFTSAFGIGIALSDWI